MRSGGSSYFPNAWVCINLLRAWMPLPIQVWHRGKKELDTRMAALLTPLGVECMDTNTRRRTLPRGASVDGGSNLTPSCTVLFGKYCCWTLTMSRLSASSNNTSRKGRESRKVCKKFEPIHRGAARGRAWPGVCVPCTRHPAEWSRARRARIQFPFCPDATLELGSGMQAPQEVHAHPGVVVGIGHSPGANHNAPSAIPGPQ